MTSNIVRLGKQSPKTFNIAGMILQSDDNLYGAYTLHNTALDEDTVCFNATLIENVVVEKSVFWGGKYTWCLLQGAVAVNSELTSSQVRRNSIFVNSE